MNLMSLPASRKGYKNSNRAWKYSKENQKDSVYFAIFYAVYDSLLEEKENFDFCQDNEKLAEVVRRDSFDKLEVKKESLE